MSQTTNQEREDKISEMSVAIHAAYGINQILGATPREDEQRGYLEDGLDIILGRCLALSNEIAR